MFILRQIGPVTAQTEIELLSQLDISGDFELRLLNPDLGAFYASSESGQGTDGLGAGSLPPLRLSDGDELYVFNNEPSTAKSITVLAWTV